MIVTSHNATHTKVPDNNNNHNIKLKIVAETSPEHVLSINKIPYIKLRTPLFLFGSCWTLFQVVYPVTISCCSWDHHGNLFKVIHLNRGSVWLLRQHFIDLSKYFQSFSVEKNNLFSMSYCRWLRMRRWKWCTQVEVASISIKKKLCAAIRKYSHMPMLRNRKDRLSVSLHCFWSWLCFSSWCALAQAHSTHIYPKTIRSLFQATWDMEMPIQYLHKIAVNEITFRKYQLSAFDTYCFVAAVAWCIERMGLWTTCSVCGIFDLICVILQRIWFECLFFYLPKVSILYRNAKL